MTPIYFLYSARSSGWMTTSGIYSSEIKDAKEFSQAEALKLCKLHYKNGMSEFGLIPVSFSDIKAIQS